MTSMMSVLHIAVVCGLICVISCLKLDTLSNKLVRDEDDSISCCTYSGAGSGCNSQTQAQCNSGEHCYTEFKITYSGSASNVQSSTAITRGCTAENKASLAIDSVDGAEDIFATNCYTNGCNNNDIVF